MKSALPKCLMSGVCFARTPMGKCKILTDCPREYCSFQKAYAEERIDPMTEDDKKYQDLKRAYDKLVEENQMLKDDIEAYEQDEKLLKEIDKLKDKIKTLEETFEVKGYCIRCGAPLTDADMHGDYCDYCYDDLFVSWEDAYSKIRR